ncbi:hypothetical protein [Phenylobacterium sp.]|uniref:hypothetical protein n=1 Tax=Phenylobacterium sp. TaxID=1871053 RepID=UPI0025F01875|nr:hypothetical protein [Phenylobacterium sp.]
MQKGPDRLLTASDVVVEIEGVERPALVARWLSMTLLPAPDVALDGFRRGGAQ